MSAAGPTNFPVISLISRESNPVERVAPDRSQPQRRGRLRWSISLRRRGSPHFTRVPSPRPAFDCGEVGNQSRREEPADQFGSWADPSANSERRTLPARWPCSLLRHPGFAQAGEVGGFIQCADFGHPPPSASLHATDARKRTFAGQASGFGEFGGAAFGLTFERIGRGKLATNK